MASSSNEELVLAVLAKARQRRSALLADAAARAGSPARTPSAPSRASAGHHRTVQVHQILLQGLRPAPASLPRVLEPGPGHRHGLAQPVECVPWPHFGRRGCSHQNATLLIALLRRPAPRLISTGDTTRLSRALERFVRPLSDAPKDAKSQRRPSRLAVPPQVSFPPLAPLRADVNRSVFWIMIPGLALAGSVPRFQLHPALARIGSASWRARLRRRGRAEPLTTFTDLGPGIGTFGHGLFTAPSTSFSSVRLRLLRTLEPPGRPDDDEHAGAGARRHAAQDYVTSHGARWSPQAFSRRTPIPMIAAAKLIGLTGAASKPFDLLAAASGGCQRRFRRSPGRAAGTVAGDHAAAHPGPAEPDPPRGRGLRLWLRAEFQSGSSASQAASGRPARHPLAAYMPMLLAGYSTISLHMSRRST